MLSTILFVLKQLLPLKYETKFTVTDDSGKNELMKVHCTWRMWFFKSFHIKTKTFTL